MVYLQLWWSSLLLRCSQRGANIPEHGVQFAADALHSRDNRDCDTSGNEAVFDCSCAGFIGKKSLEHALQLRLPQVALELTSNL